MFVNESVHDRSLFMLMYFLYCIVNACRFYSHVAQMWVLGENTSLDCMQVGPHDSSVTNTHTQIFLCIRLVQL